jgi:tetratricopeptide (TPR) repeat protein
MLRKEAALRGRRSHPACLVIVRTAWNTIAAQTFPRIRERTTAYGFRRITKNTLLSLVLVIAVLGSSIRSVSAADISPPSELVPQWRIKTNVKPSEWLSLWQEGRLAALNGDYERAVSKYLLLLNKKKHLVAARWELARIYMHLQELDKAIPLLELLIEADPSHQGFMNAMGKIMWEKGFYDRAVILFKKVYEANPADQFALARIIEGLIKLEQKEDVLPLLDSLKTTGDVSSEIKRFLAFLTFDAGMYRQALPYLLELAEVDRADSDIILRTAQAYDYLNMESAAVEYWKRFLSLQPDNLAAHERMVEIYEGAGDTDRALPHLRAILRIAPTDFSVMKKIGDILMAKGEFEDALIYYRRFLKEFPFDQHVLRSVIKIYADLGDRDNTIRSLEQYFAVRDPSDPSELHLEATLYDATGRFQEAIVIYKKLLEQSPDDPQILAALVNDLLAIGENDRALSMWKKLGELAADKLAVYMPMVSLLEHLGRKKELIEILEIINELDRDNSAAALKLADLYYSDNNMAKALEYYNRLLSAGNVTDHILRRKGLILESSGQLEAALENFELLLEKYPGQDDIQLRCIAIAGKLGLMHVVEKQLSSLPPSLQTVAPVEDDKAMAFYENLILVKAEAFSENGFFDTAIQELRKLLISTETAIHNSDGQRKEKYQQKHFQLLLKISRIYREWQLYEAAEQTLRIALATYPLEREHILVKLSELALQKNNLSDAQIWNAALDEELQSARVQRSTVMDWQRMLLEAELLMLNDEIDEAAEICRSLFTHSYTEHVSIHDGDSSDADLSARFRSGILLAEILIRDESLQEAAEIVQELLRQGWQDQRLLVLNEQITFRLIPTNREYSLQKMFRSLDNQHPVDLYTILNIARLYKESADWQALLICAQTALKKSPQSVKAELYLAESLLRMGRYQSALKRYRKLLAANPANTLSQDRVIRLGYENGELADALNLCDQVLQENPLRYDILLIKARILWALGSRDEALSVYDGALDEMAELLLEQKLERVDFVPGLAPVKTLWNTVTFSPGKPPPMAEVVMSADFAANPNKQFLYITNLAAPLYEQYRWQLLFAEEKEARNSIRTGEYHKALKEFTALNNKITNDPTLQFDIAYVYSRLGRLDDENMVYEHLLESNPGFPGLAEAVSRNRMQGRPSFGLRFAMREDDGWDNYKALREKKLEAVLQFSPLNNHKIRVTGSRKIYQSTASDLSVNSNRFVGRYSLRFNNSWKISLAGGVESLDDKKGDTALWAGELSGNIYDNLWGRVSYKRDSVTDTVASLTRNIIQQKTSVSLYSDVIPRLNVGGEYGFIDYSDNNHMIQYEVMAAYTLFYEPTLLEFSFRYNVQDSDRSTMAGPVLPDGFSMNDHPYWSPAYYWLNTFSLYFKHQLSDDSLDRGVGRYYTVKYSLGYDSRGYDLQALEGSFFVELNKHIILEASADIQSLKSFQSKKIQLTATARW